MQLKKMIKNKFNSQIFFLCTVFFACLFFCYQSFASDIKDGNNLIVLGKIIDFKHLSQNINSRPNILLMHGEKDEVVPIESLLEAKEFFNTHKYEIQTKIFKNCEHRIPTEGSSLGLQFIKKNLY